MMEILEELPFEVSERSSKEELAHRWRKLDHADQSQWDCLLMANVAVSFIWGEHEREEGVNVKEGKEEQVKDGKEKEMHKRRSLPDHTGSKIIKLSAESQQRQEGINKNEDDDDDDALEESKQDHPQQEINSEHHNQNDSNTDLTHGESLEELEATIKPCLESFKRGKLHVMRQALCWFDEDSKRGFRIDHDSIILHAITAEEKAESPHSPTIYCQLDITRCKLGARTINNLLDSDNQDEMVTCELHITPLDPSMTRAIYDAICDCMGTASVDNVEFEGKMISCKEEEWEEEEEEDEKASSSHDADSEER